MGLVDTITKVYMKNNVIFADVFNYLIYDGKAVIDPGQLLELDIGYFRRSGGDLIDVCKAVEEMISEGEKLLYYT